MVSKTVRTSEGRFTVSVDHLGSTWTATAVDSTGQVAFRSSTPDPTGWNVSKRQPQLATAVSLLVAEITKAEKE